MRISSKYLYTRASSDAGVLSTAPFMDPQLLGSYRHVDASVAGAVVGRSSN